MVSSIEAVERTRFETRRVLAVAVARSNEKG